MELIRDTSGSAVCQQAAVGPTQDILAPTPIALQHAVHRRRQGASLAGGRSLFAVRITVYGWNGAREILARRLGQRVQSLSDLVTVLLGPMTLVLFIFSCRKLENGMLFKGLSSYATTDVECAEGAN